ncbi:MAG: response regulator [Myxococcota bacterium]|jgi:CheY-like chemotaxis protein|nr:response regulator [Myxococcota bacterium]
MSIKLLLADDSVVIQKLVGLSFANEDIEIITVDNGDDAVTQAISGKPDIVLADVVMPGKNGYEVCSEIRNNPELGNTPVLLLTGTFEAFDEGRASEVGATGHITKPFEAQALVDRVSEILAAQPGPAAAPAAANTGSDFFDENTGDLGMNEASEQTKPLAAPPAPAAPTEAVDYVFGEIDPVEHASVSPTATGEIDEGLGMEAQADDPMGGDHTVAIMPDSDEPVSEAWSAPPVSAPTPPLPTEPAEPVATPNPDQTMLIDDFLGSDTPAPMPAPVPLEEVDAISGLPATDDLDGLSFDDAAMGGANSGADLSAPSGDETVLADDLFRDGADLSAPLDAPAAPAPAASQAPPAMPSASQGLDIDFGAPVEADSIVPDNAGDYDVSASDLQIDPLAGDSGSWGKGVPTGVVTGPDPITPPHDVAAPPEAEPAPSVDPAPASAGARSSGDLSPDMRGRIHDTLEKVAWEAFSDLSDDLVKQLVGRVEQIAWEVIPQMAETLIREEIRKMKANEGEGA